MRGMAMSHPPKRVDDAHAHGAQTRQQAAGGADQEREPQAKGEKRLGKEKRGQQTGEGYADDRDGQVGERQADESSNQRDDDGLREDEKKNRAPGETDSFEDG